MTVKRLDRAQLTSAPAEAPYRRERQRTLPPQPTRHVGPNSMSPIQDPRPTHLMHPGSAQFVVGLMHVCANAEGMGSRGDAEYRARRRERERRRRADQEPAAARRDRSPDVPPVQPGAGGGARRAAATTCGWCNGPITLRASGPIPKWCSATCRHRAWEQKGAAESGRAAIRVVERVVVTPAPPPQAKAPRHGEWVDVLLELAEQIDRTAPASPHVLVEHHAENERERVTRPRGG